MSWQEVDDYTETTDMATLACLAIPCRMIGEHGQLSEAPILNAHGDQFAVAATHISLPGDYVYLNAGAITEILIAGQGYDGWICY